MEQQDWSEDKISEYLSNENTLKLKVQKALDGFSHPFTALVLIEAKNYAQVKEQILEKFGAEFYIIYITLNSGYGKLCQELASIKAGMGNVFCIDMVTVESGGEAVGSKGAVFLSSPMELTDCVVAVEKKLLEKKSAKCLVVLDSVSTMLIYNNPGSVEKFLHTALGKINAENSSAIVLSSDFGERDSVTSTIGQFFDRTVKV